MEWKSLAFIIFWNQQTLIVLVKEPNPVRRSPSNPRSIGLGWLPRSVASQITLHTTYDNLV